MSQFFEAIAPLIPTLVIVILPTIIDVAGITAPTTSASADAPGVTPNSGWGVPVITLIIASFTS